MEKQGTNINNIINCIVYMVRRAHSHSVNIKELFTVTFTFSLTDVWIAIGLNQINAVFLLVEINFLLKGFIS